jgi:hypothetical protein
MILTFRNTMPWLRTLLYLMLLGALLSACVLSDGAPSVTGAAPVGVPSAASEGWEPIADGMWQYRLVPDEAPSFTIHALRFDLAAYDVRVHYTPGMARSLQEWRDLLPEAEAIINANFFDEADRVLGLLVSDGVAHGQSYKDRGGTFALAGAGPAIWFTPDRPPAAGDGYSHLVQAFPMLVSRGNAAYTDPRAVRLARRSAIGLDRQGHLVLLATPLLGQSLPDLSRTLAESTTLDLQDAFNLDGGGSTMLYAGASQTIIPSFDPVPAVLAVYRR